MLNKDYANTILNANRLGLSLDFSPIPNKWEKLPQVVSQGISDWDKVQKTNAYVNALQGGNQDEINQAWSAYDPQGYANYQQDQAKRAEDRQWKLEDMEKQYDYNSRLLRDKLNGEFDLAKYKAQNVGYDPTAAERNVAAMVATGKFTPDQAWAIQFAGGNPSFDVSQLGQKGFEAYDKASGERMAEKAEAMDLLGQTQSAYDDMFSKGGLVEQAQIGAGMPDTIAGRIGGAIDRAVPTTLVNSDAQKARQQIQYLMGGLRLNEASAMKGALSDSEQKFLSDMVAGNVKGYSPYEMQGAFEGIINKLKRKAGAPSLKQVNQLVTDPRVQEALDNGYSMEEIQKHLGK